MPILKQHIDEFFAIIKSDITGFKNAKSTRELTIVQAKIEGIEVGDPYTRQFRTMKSKVNNWLKLLRESGRLKMTSRPTEKAIDENIYWVD